MNAHICLSLSLVLCLSVCLSVSLCLSFSVVGLSFTLMQDSGGFRAGPSRRLLTVRERDWCTFNVGIIHIMTRHRFCEHQVVPLGRGGIGDGAVTGSVRAAGSLAEAADTAGTADTAAGGLRGRRSSSDH